MPVGVCRDVLGIIPLQLAWLKKSGVHVVALVVEMAVVVVYLCFRVDGSNLRCTTPQHKFTTA